MRRKNAISTDHNSCIGRRSSWAKYAALYNAGNRSTYALTNLERVSGCGGSTVVWCRCGTVKKDKLTISAIKVID
jgi:hypothetical protein